MIECFQEIEFKGERLNIVNAVIGICQSFADQGYDMTVRQVYYQLVAHDVFPDSRKWRWTSDNPRVGEKANKWVRDPNGTKNAFPNYTWLSTIISDARMSGVLDWDMIKDRGRETTKNSHWTSPSDILDACAYSFRIDTWADQPNHVELMVEKQALEGVLEPVCKELDISFSANKGYASSSFLYEAGKRLSDKAAKGKELHVIYLGDHDPSGIDMTRDIRDRLMMFSDCEINVHRIALNMDQVRQYNPPENPAKLTDSRAAGYIERFGDSSWELDALSPSVLAQLVRDTVEGLRDPDIDDEAQEKQAVWKAELREMASKYKSA